MTDTPRKPGRPRKAEPVAEQPVAQPQYTIAKLTAHMLAGEIHRLHQEGEDITPIHQVSDTIRAKGIAGEDIAAIIRRKAELGEDLAAIHEASDGVRGRLAIPGADNVVPAPSVAPDKIAELKAAVEAAKTSTDKPRTFAVAFHSKRGALRLAHGVEYEDGEIRIHDGRGFAGAYADDMNELHEEATKRHGNAYHVDYTD
jgi:hypothetical protein